MKVSYIDLKNQFKRILLSLSFNDEKAELCAGIFAGNSLDGVYSHGVNRFPVFVNYVKQGLIDINAEPRRIENNGLIQVWDGQLAPGMYIATKAMESAISIAKSNGMGCVVVR